MELLIRLQVSEWGSNLTNIVLEKDEKVILQKRSDRQPTWKLTEYLAEIHNNYGLDMYPNPLDILSYSMMGFVEDEVFEKIEEILKECPNLE